MHAGYRGDAMRILTRVALVLLTVTTTGCVVESRLRPDGSGRLTLAYHLDDNATLAPVVQRLEAPAVMVRAARIDRQRIGTFKVEFADAGKLSQTETFKQVVVTRAAGAQAGTTDFTAKIVQPKPFKLSDKMLEHFGNDLKVTITFPGEVVATNATSHQGATASWIVPLQTVTSSPETVFSATYKDAAAPAGG
jgi:hypothetical protein